MRYYTLSYVATVARQPYELLAAAVDSRIEWDKTTGYPCIPEDVALTLPGFAAALLASTPAPRRITGEGAEVPALRPEDLQICAAQSLLADAGCASDLLGLEGADRLTYDKEKAYIAKLAMKGRYWARMRGSSMYYSMKQFSEPDTWASPAEDAFLRASVAFRAATRVLIDKGSQSHVEAPKRPVGRPKGPVLVDCPVLDIALCCLPASSSQYAKGTIGALERVTRETWTDAAKLEEVLADLHATGTPQAWEEWMPMQLPNMAQLLCGEYHKLLREDRLGIKRAMGTLSDDAHHRAMARARAEWSADAVAWNTSPLQALLPEGFRLVF